MDAYDDDMESPEALRERLRRLEMAVDATGLGLWDWDVPSGELVWNARNYELFGLTHHRPLTIQDYPVLVHPDDRERVNEAYREARDQPDGGDYIVEHRTANMFDGKVRWLQARGRVQKSGDGVMRVIGSTLDITARKVAEERRSLLLGELAHRAKNGILVMMAIAAQTARSATSVAHFEELLMARLKAMADSQDLVTEAGGRPLVLGDLVGRALTPFDADRFDIDPGVSGITIQADMVVAMALLLHELSTNAVKYGALSAPKGRVRLVLGPPDGNAFLLTWTEDGGPPVQPVTRKGFGSRLLDISLRNNGGRVEGVFDPQGFRADIRFPGRTT